MNGEIGLCAIKGLPEQHCRKGIGLILFSVAVPREVRECLGLGQGGKGIP